VYVIIIIIAVVVTVIIYVITNVLSDDTTCDCSPLLMPLFCRTVNCRSWGSSTMTISWSCDISSTQVVTRWHWMQ